MYYIRQTFIVNLFFGKLCKTTTNSLDYSDFKNDDRDFRGFSEISIKLIESFPRVC